MRQEKKYLLRSFEILQVEKKLMKLGFRIKHLPNIVNNIYFDDRDNKSAIENIEGDNIRSKFRLRWYNEENKFKLEEKIKYSSSGKKNVTDLNSNNVYDAILEIKSLLPSYFPVVQNKYHRKYFEFEELRVTIDTRLIFNKPFEDRVIYSDKNIMEIKYETEIDNLLKEVFEFTPQLTKFSKYLEGLNSVAN